MRKGKELKYIFVNDGTDINVAIRNIIAYAAQKTLNEQGIRGYTVINSK